ncbi:phosphotransferase enzyme family protein [Nocardioides sp. MAHUQ-72]|uniref:phosphotransferase enzyme family protein n=1 Tax=unclassified Nocardioides TaxID=2615069 RepID=UPI00360E2F85
MLEPHLGARVAGAFALGGHATLTGPVAAGRLGRVWRLETDRGTWAVKDTPHPVSAAEVARDAAYQDTVRAHGVPMPAVVRAPDGSALVDVEGPVRAYSWVDVQPREQRLDPVAVGRLLAAVHAVRVPTREPVDGWYVDAVDHAVWDVLVTRLESAGAPFAGRLATLLPAMGEAARVLAPPDDVQLCHRDLWADNLLRRHDGGLVVLDWENSGPAGPAHELAMVTYEFGCGEPARMRAVRDAYADAGGTARITGPADLTMLVAQTHHILQTGCERWLASVDEEGRADNEAWVSEFLDDPVDGGTVELLLSALA